MSNDKPNGPVSKGRRFGRGLFSSRSKEDSSSSRWLKPPPNSLVPEVQAHSRPISPAPEPQPRPASPAKEKVSSHASKPAADPKLTRRQSKSSSLFELFSKPR